MGCGPSGGQEKGGTVMTKQEAEAHWKGFGFATSIALLLLVAWLVW